MDLLDDDTRLKQIHTICSCSSSSTQQIALLSGGQESGTLRATQNSIPWLARSFVVQIVHSPPSMSHRSILPHSTPVNLENNRLDFVGGAAQSSCNERTSSNTATEEHCLCEWTHQGTSNRAFVGLLRTLSTFPPPKKLPKEYREKNGHAAPGYSF